MRLHYKHQQLNAFRGNNTVRGLKMGLLSIEPNGTFSYQWSLEELGHAVA
jgi:hypothetical protein